MIITEQQLRDLNACEEGIKYFNSLKSHRLTDVYISTIRDKEFGYFEFLCKNIPIDKDNQEFKKVLINTKNADCIYLYLENINKDDKEIRKALINTGNVRVIHRCLNYINKYDKEFEKALRASKHAISFDFLYDGYKAWEEVQLLV